jgi:hypothetical protein
MGVSCILAMSNKGGEFNESDGLDAGYVLFRARVDVLDVSIPESLRKNLR